MVILASFLSIVTVNVDQTISAELAQNIPWIYINTPEGAREVLSTIASSMITVAGVVFSLVMVVLSLTSQQYGPFVLIHFLRDRTNQFVLGTFTATFIYSLLVLRTVRSIDSSTFVPNISTIIAVILSLASLALLIHFIHHISTSIRASAIIARIASELINQIDDLFPERIGDNPSFPVHLPSDFDSHAYTLECNQSGYLKLIDDDQVLDTTQKHDVLFVLECHPGQFMVKGTTIGKIYPNERVNEKLIHQIHDAFVFGFLRSQHQDAEFLLIQLSAIAVRALSPGVNDPHTATMCIDRLGEALSLLAQRAFPSAYRFDKEQQLRVIAQPVQYDHLIEIAFDQILHYGGNDAYVAKHLLHTLGIIAKFASEERRAAVQAYSERVWKTSQDCLQTEWEKQIIDSEYQRILKTFVM